MKKFQIIILGASTAHGNWDDEGGWAERLRKHCINQVLSRPGKLIGHVFNLGVPGDTSKNLLNRLDDEISARLFYEETMIIMSIGTNDSKIISETGRASISEGEFEKNVEQLLRKAQRYASSVLFLGLTPVDETRTDPWHGKDSFLNVSTQKYNEIAKKVCDSNQVPFIDLFSDFPKTDYLHYISDGLHPNSLGHEKIFNLVKSFVDEFLDRP